MSGFLVIHEPDGKPVDRELLVRMTDRLAERGPDDRRIWSVGNLGMGHAQHRTTDQDVYDCQPLCSDGATRMVSSARIDDREALLDRLGGAGGSPLERTPDSELILRAFRKWDTDCPARLLGDFAFAIWDGPTRRLVCARDRFGMRQLYYARAGSTWLVSNSLFCLLGYPGISRRLDEGAVGGFLLFGDHTWADKGITAFADVRALPPAHRLVIREGRLTLDRYWDFPVEMPLLRCRRDGDCIERFRWVFGQAVADRLRTGSATIAMSGGMDSSAIAATALKTGGAENGPVDLYALTVLFDGIMPSDERRYASLAAERLGIGIRFLDGGRYSFLEPPVATTRPLELYSAGGWLEMYRAAAELSPVLLHGEGGDSLFSYSMGLRTLAGVGSTRIALDLIRLRVRFGTWPALGTGFGRLGRRLMGGGAARSQANPRPYPVWLNAEFERRLGLRERWEDIWNRQPSPLNARHPAMHVALTGPDWHLEEQFLRPGLTLPEVRDPFLDLRLIELMLALPPMPWTFRKYMLRRAMTGDLPEEVLGRPKTPLGEVHTALLQRPEARWLDTWRLPPELGDYVDSRRIRPLRDEGGDPDQSYLALRPLLLDRWIGFVNRTLDAEGDIGA